MSGANILSIFAAIVASAAWLPQLGRMLRRQSAADISWWYLGALETGCAAWLVYGLVIRSPGLVADNTLWCVLLAAVIAVKGSTDGKPAAE